MDEVIAVVSTSNFVQSEGPLFAWIPEYSIWKNMRDVRCVGGQEDTLGNEK